MQCPSCGWKEMEERVWDETITHANESITLTNLKGHVCPKCNDAMFDDLSYERYTHASDSLVLKARAKVK